jgi:anti-sigma-K factor RskA
MTPDDQVEAAELALGLLDGAERTAAVERMLADSEFAMEVAWWRDRFAALLHGYDPVEPPAGLLAQIALPDAKPTPEPVAVIRPRWNWFAGGAAAGAVAASLVALLTVPKAIVPPVAPAPVRPLVAVLAPTEGAQQAPVAALVDRRDGSVRLTATIVVPADRVAELWRIGGDKVPRPFGLLAPGAVAPALLKNARLPTPDEVLAVSIEPVGGSPTGQPTGAVVATGTVVDMS